MSGKSAAYMAWLQTPEAKRQAKLREMDRARGIARIVPAARVQRILRELIDDKGVLRDTLAERMQISRSSIQHHYRGYSPSGAALTHCRRDFEERVMRGARLITSDDWAYPSTLGVRRRVQALVAAGYTFHWQAQQYGQDIAQVHAFAHGDSSRTKAEFARAVWSTYAKYANIDPLDAGCTQFQISYAKGIGRKHLWGNPSCWDDDTIDDPYSIPEFTGQCGTSNGYRIHLREDIPNCHACKTAHFLYRTYPNLATLMGIYKPKTQGGRGPGRQKTYA